MSYTSYDDDDERGDDPDADDVHDGDSIDTVPCPYCHKPVYEQAEICPHCRNYISNEEVPDRMPRWIIIVTVVLLATILLTWLGWR